MSPQSTGFYNPVDKWKHIKLTEILSERISCVAPYLKATSMKW